MKAKEFINEGVDRSPEDLKQNHPDIYDFITKVTGPFTIQDAKVNSFNSAGKHYVTIEMGPTAGLNNTRAGLDSYGVNYENVSDNKIVGELDDLEFSIEDVKQGPGNNREKWIFIIHKDMQESIVENEGISALIQKYRDIKSQLDHMDNWHLNPDIVSRLKSKLHNLEQLIRKQDPTWGQPSKPSTEQDTDRTERLIQNAIDNRNSMNAVRADNMKRPTDRESIIRDLKARGRI